MSTDASVIVPQPDRPRLPLRVPVDAELGSGMVRAEVLGSTSNVLLLEAPEGTNVPSLGTPIRLRLVWDRQVLNGRIAAHGVGGRFLVTVGERAIRRSKRFGVDLVGMARWAQIGSAQVRIKDLSTGGARVEGIDLPIGSEIELRFTPPGRERAITVLGFVVRAIPEAEPPAVGVAFRLVQPSMDVLRNSPLSAPAAV